MTAHCFGEESLRDLAAAGTDCIEHATGLQPDTIDTFAAAGHRHRPDPGQHRHLPRHRRRRREDKFPTYAAHMRDLHARRYETVAAAHDAGVPIYVGTDAGGSLPHGLVAAEAAELVKAGLSVAEVLDGRDLGRPPVAGPARDWTRATSADLVVYRDDPRKDIAVLAAPRARGAARAALPPEPAPAARARGSGSGSAPSPRTTSRRTALAVEQSRRRLSQWNPVNADDLGRHLAAQGRDHRTFVIHATAPEGDHDLVGKVNVTNVVRGRFLSAAMGYDAYDPYAGRGLFAEGLRLVVGLVLAAEPGGMGLHRLEANVQPGNAVVGRAAARPWGSSARAARRGCCGCPTRTVPSAGATTTPTR